MSTCCDTRARVQAGGRVRIVQALPPHESMWWLTIYNDDHSADGIAITNCPWCGKRLGEEGPDGAS